MILSDNDLYKGEIIKGKNYFIYRGFKYTELNIIIHLKEQVNNFLVILNNLGYNKSDISILSSEIDNINLFNDVILVKISPNSNSVTYEVFDLESYYEYANRKS